MYFLEHRAKLLDLAAFLDRVDRADGDGSEMDFRIEAMRRGIGVLLESESGRAKRVQEVFSDHSTTPIAVAGTKGASGAPMSEGSA